ncbi:Thymidine kinase [Meloidogyne graminicola]|uniref:Thymidine kinase n=1 Tax=Meloidogyne graminicola TaxID=189291 RepID=A0A8S9ZZ73_9BILA|nr:Thymidine kinase [Meloidogyne graminicola]
MSECVCYQRGSIQLIIGPMFSGKTTELFRLATRHTLAGRSVAIIKYRHDTRYDATYACTHDYRKMEAFIAETIEEVYELIKNNDVIGIDEGQFFKDLVKYSQYLADNGKIVIIAALNGDYKQEPFPNVTKLIPLAEKIEKLNAVCNCGQSASFTFRLSSNKKIEIIGGQELYRAMCRQCVIQNTKEKENRNEINKIKGKFPLEN